MARHAMAMAMAGCRAGRAHCRRRGRADQRLTSPGGVGTLGGWARRCMLAAPDERRRGRIPDPAMREQVEGSLGIRFFRPEGEDEDHRRIIDGRSQLRAKL